MLVDFGVQ